MEAETGMRASKHKAALYLLLVASYVITGKAALMLALPPGYVSAVFPPAGIAVAAAFIVGSRSLFWIFLGSLLLNVWVGWSAAHQLNLAGLLAALVIAAASMLQAAAGGWALRRSVGHPSALDNLRDISRFLLLAPFICLTSASLSVTGLWLLGIVGTDTLATNWFTWWAGDSLGVIVLFPITMVFAAPPRPIWHGRMTTVAIPMTVAFAIVVVMFLKTNQWEQFDVLAEFRQTSAQSLSQVQTRLDEQATLLSDMHGLFIHDERGSISRREFQRYTRLSLRHFPMIRAMEWAPRIVSSQRSGFEAAQQKKVPGFEITQRYADGKLARASERTQYYPVTYLEPLTGNRPAMGFDLGSNSLRYDAIVKAISSGETVATAPIRLVQASGQQNGMLIVQSVALNGSEEGVVLTVLKMNDFMNKILPAANRVMLVRLIDEDAQRVVFDDFESGKVKVMFESVFEFGGRHYRFQTSPTAFYLQRHRGWESWGVLAMGALGTGLLGALLLLGTGYTSRVVELVEERTRDFRESETRFRTMADSAPVFIWMTDKDNAANWFNQTTLAFTGHSLEQELQGAWVKAIHPDDLGCLEKFARLAEHHEPFQMEFRLKRFDGEYRWILDSGVPRYDADGNFMGYIGSGIDITDRKLANELVQHMAHYDSLTDLPNRAMFDDRMQRALATAKREKRNFAVIFLDLDNFKPINDDLGHQFGDLMLKQVAIRLLDCVRESDTVARIGGDEFVVLLPIVDDEKDALLVATKIRHALNLPFQLAGRKLTISTSAGVAIYPEHGSEAIELLRNADLAMYVAKRSGRNRIQIFRADMSGEGETEGYLERHPDGLSDEVASE
jgi:diguanylate cyclase (GGDEF)-like protein/PAS domain S-box-containing protein